MPIIDTIQLNHDYIALLEKSIQHRDNFVRGVANHIVENLLSDNTQWHYISHIDWMRARLQDYQKTSKNGYFRARRINIYSRKLTKFQ